MTDSFNRGIDYMRLSVTDRCNLRCKYCMPHDLPMLSHTDVLRNEEFIRVCKVASECGIKNIRITGGEPLARKGCVDLVRGIKALPDVEKVTMTTNGTLLSECLDGLVDAGLDGVNVSLDTLEPGKFKQMTGRDGFVRACYGLFTAIQSGISVKINCVPLRGFNDGEYSSLVRIAERNRVDVRFIESMPIGYGQEYPAVPGGEILTELKKIYPDLRPAEKRRGFGPAVYYESDKLKGMVGFINAVSHSFCGSCNRIRLTSEGFLKPCLYHDSGVDLRELLRGGATDAELSAAFAGAIGQKPERHLFSSGIQSEKRTMSRIGG